MVYEYLHESYRVLDWPTLGEVIDSFLETPSNDWWLPISACKAIGATAAEGIPAASAIIASQASIMLVDDMLDQDPRGLHITLGTGETANLAVALEALAFRCILRSSVNSEYSQRATKAFAKMFATTSFGQALDVGEISNEEEYWEVVKHKSTPFYGLALELGAHMAQVSPDLADELFSLGVLVGETVQLYDDMYDALESPARPDWRRKTNNLLILYALTVDHEDREEFSASIDRATDPEVLDRLQKILVNSGAVSYCAYQLAVRQRKCLESIRAAGFPNPNPLLELVNKQEEPLRAILESVGIDFPLEISANE